MTPAEQLTRALVDLATKGQRPRCGDPATHAYWTSDEQAEREQAVSWCAGCPILRECAAAAEVESFGVWGAVDVTPLTRRKRVQALTETRPNNPTNRRRTMPDFKNPTSRTMRQQVARGVPFRRNEEKERLLAMREERPAEFAALPPAVHISVGIYEGDRAAAEQLHQSDPTSYEQITGGAP